MLWMKCTAATALWSGVHPVYCCEFNKWPPNAARKWPDTRSQVVLFSLSVFVLHPDCCSDEEGLPGWPCVSPSIGMARLYFSTILILFSLSSISLLLLTLLPTVAPFIPFSSSPPPSPHLTSLPSPTCGQGQSWAVRLHTGPHYEKDDGEQVAVQLDVIANRVLNFNNIFCWYILFCIYGLTQNLFT